MDVYPLLSALHKPNELEWLCGMWMDVKEHVSEPAAPTHAARNILTQISDYFMLGTLQNFTYLQSFCSYEK